MQAPVLAKEEGNSQKSKQVAPLILAFLSGWHDVICFKQYRSDALMPTGNTVNLFMQFGNRDYSNVKFLLSCIINYCAGIVSFRFTKKCERATEPDGYDCPGQYFVDNAELCKQDPFNEEYFKREVQSWVRHGFMEDFDEFEEYFF